MWRNHLSRRRKAMSEQKRSEDLNVRMLRMKYRALEEQWEHSHYWSTEHIAFHQIGTALQSPDPAQALQERVAKARTNLAQKEQMLLDGLFHGNPESFRK